MILNPIFSRSGEGLNSDKKTEYKLRKVLHKKLKLQTYLKGGKIFGRVSKSPSITWAYTLIKDNFRWSKTSKKNFDLYIQWFELNEGLAIFNPFSTQRIKQID